jgi:pyridoxamine 5'-phosphate oxidase
VDPADRLDVADVDPDPMAQFERWFGEAVAAGVPEPNAMAVSTVGSDGAPSLRFVLLKGVDERGFQFFTNYRSRKGRELDGNSRVALAFRWFAIARQVTVAGTARRLEAEESDAYFRSRARGSQLGAWASPQSEVLDDRRELEARLAEVEARFAGRDVPRPPHWGGFLVAPARMELWQGRENRLHDRVRYLRDGARWRIERLAP